MSLRPLLQLCRTTAAPLGLYDACYQSARQLHREPSLYSDYCPPDGVARSTGPLGGLVMAVSDCINVRGVRTTNGVTASTMLHHMPEADDPIIEQLRATGVRFVGKLASQTPFAFAEGETFDISPAVEALNAKSCHAVLVSSLASPPGIAAAHCGGVAFVPTAGSLIANAGSSGAPAHRAHLAGLKYTHGFVASSLDDLDVLWSGLAEGGADSSVEPSSEDGESNEDAAPLMGSGSRQRSRAPSDSSQEDMGSHVEIQVGVPEECLAGLDRDRHGSTFISCLQRHLQAQQQTKNEARNTRVIVETVSIQRGQFDLAIRCGIIKANYELAQAINATLDMNGVMQELPQSLIPAITAGRNTSQAQYEEAVEQIGSLHDQLDAELQEVDVVAMPLLSSPFVSGDLRSLTFAMPWFLSGYPMISLPLPFTGANGTGVGPVLLVGEMGDDRGLFQQASVFVKAAC